MSPDAARVLAKLCDASPEPGGRIPLRRLAVQTLGGDWPAALGALEDLDTSGYIRAEIAGWIEGWVTERGRAVHRARFEGQA